jgi:transketolase
VTGRRGDRPLLVVCHTVKGKGVSFMEHVPVWHYRSPNAAELKQAIAELEKDEA